MGEAIRKKGELYLEDNFYEEKRVGVPENIFMIGNLCDGEIIGFDMNRTDKNDGCVVQYDVESGEILQEWESLYLWLDLTFEEGQILFDDN